MAAIDTLTLNPDMGVAGCVLFLFSPFRPFPPTAQALSPFLRSRGVA